MQLRVLPGGWIWVSCLRRPHYEEPQRKPPGPDEPLDSGAAKKKRRLEDFVKKFRDKREEEWSAVVKSRQKAAQFKTCFSPSCRKGLQFPPVAGGNSLIQSCYNASCRKKYAEASEPSKKDTVKKVCALKPHVVTFEMLKEKDADLGKDKPFPPPVIQTFRTPHTQKRSILVIDKPAQKALAKIGGVRQIIIPGFRWDSKNSPVLWPYPCARPTFETCWRYMTQTGNFHTKCA